MEYIQVSNEDELPEISKLKPYKCVVVIEQDVSLKWQQQVSAWLCATGCMYMMAWGKECSSWNDSVDYANLEQFIHEDIPDESFVMTTWHENEPLKEVFWYAKHAAFHEQHELEHTLVLHISEINRKKEISLEYKNA